MQQPNGHRQKRAECQQARSTVRVFPIAIGAAETPKERQAEDIAQFT
jgi:hypothetical protein